MNLPKKIKFGHRTMDVRYDAELSPSRELLATSHGELGYIRVQSSLPESVQGEMIFRSCLGDVVDICGLTHDAKDRARIGTGVLAVIRDNPGLIHTSSAADGRTSMPDKVRIFGQDWTVISENEHYDYVGRKLNVDNTLHINSAYKGNLGWQILWHEILHAIWDKLSLELSLEENERDVELLAFCLCTIFTQNDFSWVLEITDES